VGRELYIDFIDQPLNVTAVINDFPETTHFRASFFLDWQSFLYMIKMMNLEDMYNSHGWAGVYTYALLRQGTDSQSLKNKLSDFRKSFYSVFTNPEDVTGEFYLQPITDIHLRSNLEQEIDPNGNLAYVLIFSLGALFILIIAGVNYVNIVSARAFKRMKEIGIRKVSGANKSQIINQFQGESILTALISGAIAVLFIDLTIPLYNAIAMESVTTGEIFTAGHIVFFVLIIILLGSLSGLYPSIFVSGFNPVESIKDQRNPRSSANLLRQIFVILQFAVSIFMIFSTIVIYRQMKYFNEKNLGFNSSHIVIINLNGSLRTMAVNNPQTLKNEFAKLPFVSGTSISSNILGETFSVEGLFLDNKPEDSDNPSLRFSRVDEDFLNLLNIKLIDGKNFSYITGDNSQFILNQRAVEAPKLDQPIGTKATSLLRQHGEIIGVTENFNFAYRIEIRSLDFLLAALIALIIALISVSYQSIRAGRMNPARSLRYE